MCFVPKIDMPPVPSSPQRDNMASFVQGARMAALKAKGVNAAVATSPLGDSGFGTNVRRARLLGNSAPVGA